MALKGTHTTGRDATDLDPHRTQSGSGARRIIQDEEETPTQIGRHRVLERVGAGGMGVVYAAFDPELDRKIAIKLVRGARPEAAMATAARTRMKREAQAMARLNHRNVITVYDVGEHAERLYIAMEFIDGESLKERLEREPRPRWNEVLDLFAQAGEGLVAAHRAGLVHRDFKPDNAMIGADGVVRVLDFGLAHSDKEAREDSEQTATFDSEQPLLTRSGLFAGTPAYMAPEQLAGEPSDARADQFSFAVALHEGLYGERPFAGDTLHALALAVTEGELRAPKNSLAAPAWVYRVLLRGLANDPERRWPSVEAMLDRIARRRTRPRKWAIGAAAALALGGGSLGVASWLRGEAAVCSGAAAALEGVWDPDRAASVREQLLATDLGYAEQMAPRVVENLDAWREAWLSTHQDACEATRIREEQSEAVLDRRMACLHERRAAVSSLVDALERADAKLAERADSITGGLPDPRACSDLAALERTAPIPQGDPAVTQRVYDLRARLFGARGHFEGGDLAKATAIYEEAVKTAEEIGFDPLIAEALDQLGSARESEGRPDDAEALYKRAYSLALASGHDDAAHRSAMALGYLAAFHRGHAADANHWVSTARGLAQRAQLDAAAIATIDVNEAQFLLEQGKFDEGIALAERGRLQLMKVAEDDDPRLLESFQVHAMAHARRSELPEARALFEEAVVLASSRSELHPSVARVRVNLAVVMKMMGEIDAATKALEDALPVFIGAYGEEHPHVATILFDLGASARDRGDLREAKEYFDRTLRVREAILGEEHPEVASTLEGLAGVELDEKRPAQAVPLFRRAIAIRNKTQPDNPRLEQALTQLASTLVALEQPVEALELLDRAVAILERVHGPDHVRVARPLNTLGQSLVTLERYDEAIAPLERALALRVADTALAPIELANTRWVLSQALWHSGTDRPRAQKLARLARDGFASAEAVPPATTAAIETWVVEISATRTP
ncbi:MAG: serine/threonine-protein kinase [Myxococcota bacterium]